MSFHKTLGRQKRERKLPAENGSICAGGDQGAVVGADLDAGDAATMSHSHMGHHTLHVVPNLDQLVVTTW